MLISLNFAIIQCQECNEVIKIEPQSPFDSTIHVCSKKPLTTDKPTTAKAKKAPVKKPTKTK